MKTTTPKTIEIIISSTGRTQVETKGFSGSECRDASQFIEDALGPASQETLTNEFYQAASEQLENRQAN